MTVTAARSSSAGKTETAAGVSGRWGRWDGVDRVRGFDPGLTQLRTAVQAVLGIAIAVSAEYVFARTTGPCKSTRTGRCCPRSTVRWWRPSTTGC